MTLGERIKAVRELRGWNQQELSRRAHVRQALISELESGKKADTTGSVLARLARTLGVSIDYLVGMYEEDEAEAIKDAKEKGFFCSNRSTRITLPDGTGVVLRAMDPMA